MIKKNFYNLSFDELKSFLTQKLEIDEKKVSMRAKQIFHAVYRKGLKIDEALEQLKALLKSSNEPLIEIFIKSIEVSERGILR